MIALTVELNRADLVDDLVSSLRRGECVARRVGHRACRVVHTAARDENEARTELAFFLRAWQVRHPQAEASVVT
jgi:hypothetical protein